MNVLENGRKKFNKTVLTILKITSASFFLYVFSAVYTYAYTVNSISVRGNSRISNQVIVDQLGIKPHSEFTDADIDTAVKNLFSMGYFSNVHVTRVGKVLRVSVNEYNLVNQVFFQGNKKLKTTALRDAMLTKASKAYNPTDAEADVKAIKSVYKSMGMSDVDVRVTTVDAGNGSVNVIFYINESKTAKVKKITFVGNSIFSQRRLRNVIHTKESGLFTWLTNSDVYNPDRVAVDEEALRNFYFNHGYADFRVISSKAVVEPGSNNYDLVFTVSEGEKYKFGGIQIESLVNNVDPDLLYNVLYTKTGDEYNKDKIESSILALNDKIAQSGYAFAKVDAHSDHNFDNHTISLIYSISQGPRLYLERIDIEGNTITKDYVIRREFPFSEGDALNATQVRRAKRRLEGLGFFNSVDISTVPGSAPDQVVLKVKVSEASTGEFSVGGGYTSGGATPGASFDASVSEKNFLGRGHFVRLGMNIGQASAKSFNFSYTDPYFMGHKLPVGIDVFHTHYRMDNSYDVLEMGASPRVDLPITDNLTANLTYNYIQENYNLGSNVKPDDLHKHYAGAIVKASQSHWLRSSIEYGLTYNSLDSMVIPRQGIYAKAVQEFAGLGGNAKYLKTTGKVMWYNTLSERNDIVALLSGGAGMLHETKTDGARAFDFFRNDNNLIRGFRYNGIGPRQKSGDGSTFFVGGRKFFNATAELQYPLPFVSETLGMRGAVFSDVGSVYDAPTNVEKWEKPIEGNKMAIRSSVGVSLIWASPLGPLRFDYAWPLKKCEGDIVESFNFGVSSRF